MNGYEVYAGSALLGALTGVRSMSAPAILTRLAEGPGALESLGRFKTASTLMAAGEAIADKLPVAPNRTDAGPLAGRAIMGGFAGGAFCAAKKRSILAGALIGAAAAVGATYGAFHLRRYLKKQNRVPDLVAGVMEDVAIGALSAALMSRLREAE